MEKLSLYELHQKCQQNYQEAKEEWKRRWESEWPSVNDSTKAKDE